MTKKVILVTGATGFLGSNIIKALRQRDDVRLIAACRSQSRLPVEFEGEVREGDLCDPVYRRSAVQDVDVVCHAGTWAAMWNHARHEGEKFYRPTVDLLEQAIAAGVKRFVMASTVAIAQSQTAATRYDDFSPTGAKEFWPHLDYLVQLDSYMKANANRGMQMVTLRLGHFVGAGNRLGLVPVLLPRLKSRIVPWLAGGKSRLPLIADTDLGNAFVAAAFAEALQGYESFNICGAEFPTTREVFDFIVQKTGLPKPLYSVPYPAGYMFAWLMEKLFPLLPGRAPFLTRSIVHLAEEWVCDGQYAEMKLGYRPKKNWQDALEEAVTELESRSFPWPYLAQV